MKYDFDEIIDRRNTNAVKIETPKAIWGRNDLLPLWVADMDFRTPPFIMEAIRRRCEHEILGYTTCPENWHTSIIQWLQKRFNWKVGKDMLGFTPGIVPGIAHTINCFTRPGDRILIQPPVYYPFFSVVKRNGRELALNPLQLKNGQYRMDFDQLRKDIKGCKLFVLCNPHNPGGRVWTKEELATIADICDENGVLVVSDEIHADLTFPEFRHTPFATVSEKASANSIILMSPSKVFNMPGLCTSYYVAENPKIKSIFDNYLKASELDNGNLFAFIGTATAYSNGTDWLDQMLAYVQKNIDFMEDYLQKNIPEITIIRPQASFLVLLDCRQLGLPQKELVRFFVEEAHLFLNDGTMFGQKEGTGFMRMNVACPKSILQKALRQLEHAVKKGIGL